MGIHNRMSYTMEEGEEEEEKEDVIHHGATPASLVIPEMIDETSVDDDDDDDDDYDDDDDDDSWRFPSQRDNMMDSDLRRDREVEREITVAIAFHGQWFSMSHY